MRLLLGLAALGSLLVFADLAAAAEDPAAWTQQDDGAREEGCPAVLPLPPVVVARSTVEDAPRVSGETMGFSPAPAPRGLSPPSLP